MSSREEKLTSVSSTNAPVNEKPQTAIKRASTGIIPDMTFEGRGVKVQGVVENSGAQKAGIVTEDIITAINDIEINDLRSLSEALKKFQPHQDVRIQYLHNGEKRNVILNLGER